MQSFYWKNVVSTEITQIEGEIWRSYRLLHNYYIVLVQKHLKYMHNSWVESGFGWNLN